MIFDFKKVARAKVKKEIIIYVSLLVLSLYLFFASIFNMPVISPIEIVIKTIEKVSGTKLP